jgi:hypothetical protein
MLPAGSPTKKALGAGQPEEETVHAEIEDVTSEKKNR